MLKKPNNPVFPVLFFLLAAAVMMYSGCASIKPEQTYKSDREALETAERLSDFNREIKASKGRGLLTIAAKKQADPVPDSLGCRIPGPGENYTHKLRHPRGNPPFQ